MSSHTKKFFLDIDVLYTRYVPPHNLSGHATAAYLTQRVVISKRQATPLTTAAGGIRLSTRYTEERGGGAKRPYRLGSPARPPHANLHAAHEGNLQSTGRMDIINNLTERRAGTQESRVGERPQSPRRSSRGLAPPGRSCSPWIGKTQF